MYKNKSARRLAYWSIKGFNKSDSQIGEL
jgi:hypothetical protein